VYKSVSTQKYQEHGAVDLFGDLLFVVLSPRCT
jgi:hypothetical protein